MKPESHSVAIELPLEPRAAVAGEAQELAAELERLREQGGAGFDPVGFRYLEAMVSRAGALPGLAATAVADKAQHRLAQFQQTFADAKRRAATELSAIETTYPTSADQAQQLLALGDFKALSRLHKQLARAQASPQKQRQALKALTEQALRGGVVNGPSAAEGATSGSLQNLLEQQEADIVGTVSVPGVPERSTGELKSLQRFRQTLGPIAAERLLVQEVQDGPENPGPLNQHMLALRSLKAMRDLSPQYFNRFVSHMNTLLWLEKSKVTKPRAAAKKTKAKTKSK